MVDILMIFILIFFKIFYNVISINCVLFSLIILGTYEDASGIQHQISRKDAAYVTVCYLSLYRVIKYCSKFSVIFHFSLGGLGGRVVVIRFLGGEYSWYGSII